MQLRTFSLLFALMLSASARAGWQGTEWGMSAADIRAKFPDAIANTDRDNIDGAMISTVSIPRYEVGGCVWRVNFWFQRGGGLTRVALTGQDSDRDAAGRCYHSARDLLAQRYGGPGTERISRPARLTQQLDVTWLAEAMRIGLHIADVPKARKAYVSISYEPDAPLPLPIAPSPNGANKL